MGDMEFKAGNRAIRDHADDGKDIHLFRYVRKAFVEYVGQFVCTGSHDRRAPDVHGNDHRVQRRGNDLFRGNIVDKDQYPRPQRFDRRQLGGELSLCFSQLLDFADMTAASRSSRVGE